jgi:hypothetical protein
MKKLTIAIGLGLTLASGTALAAFSTPIFLGNVETDLDSTGNPIVLVGFASQPTGLPSACASATQGIVKVGVGNANANAEWVRTVTGIATGALLAGKPVQINFAGCTTIGASTYANVIGLLMRP